MVDHMAHHRLGECTGPTSMNANMTPCPYCAAPPSDVHSLHVVDARNNIRVFPILSAPDQNAAFPKLSRSHRPPDVPLHGILLKGWQK